MGVLVRTHRQRFGLTQEELGDRAGLGSKYISEIERGTRDVPLSTLQALVEDGLGLRLECNFTEGRKAGARAREITPLPLPIDRLARQIAELPNEARGAVLVIVRTALALVSDSLAPSAQTRGSASR